MDDLLASTIVLSDPQALPATPSQAVILAAGRGQRLGDRVEEFPKCLLKVGGRSLLDHQLSMLAADVTDEGVLEDREVTRCVGDSLELLNDDSCGIGDAEALLEELCKVSPDAFCTE